MDSQGFEYADEADIGNYGPVERGYHLARRRLWARVRERTAAETKVGWVEFEVGSGLSLFCLLAYSLFCLHGFADCSLCAKIIEIPSLKHKHSIEHLLSTRNISFVIVE